MKVAEGTPFPQGGFNPKVLNAFTTSKLPQQPNTRFGARPVAGSDWLHNTSLENSRTYRNLSQAQRQKYWQANSASNALYAPSPSVHSALMATQAHPGNIGLTAKGILNTAAGAGLNTFAVPLGLPTHGINYMFAPKGTKWNSLPKTWLEQQSQGLLDKGYAQIAQGTPGYNTPTAFGQSLNQYNMPIYDNVRLGTSAAIAGPSLSKLPHYAENFIQSFRACLHCSCQ